MEKIAGIIVLGLVAMTGLAVVGWAVYKGGDPQMASLAITAAASVAGTAVGGIAGFITGMIAKGKKAKAGTNVPTG